MTRVGKWAMLFVATALPLGCGTATRPYVNDPLLRDGSGVRGDPTRSQSRELAVTTVPVPPRPPDPTALVSGDADEKSHQGQMSITLTQAP